MILLMGRSAATRRAAPAATRLATPGSMADAAPARPAMSRVGPLAEAVEPVERAAVERALAACDGNLSATARVLSIDRNTLKRKLAAYKKSAGRK